MLIQELGKLIREIAPLMSQRGEIEKCAQLDSEAIGQNERLLADSSQQ